MEKELTKSEVEAELADHSENMSRRIEGMESEVTSTYEDVLAWIKQRPLITLGGALALGVLTGYLIGSMRGRKQELTALQEQLTQQYLEAMEERIEQGIGTGLSRREALHEALGDNVPLIIYQREDEISDDRSLGRSLSFMLKTMFGFVLREAAEELVHNLVVGATSKETSPQAVEAKQDQA